jgi:hypothetical protein
VNLVEPVPDELTIVGTRRGDLFEKRRKLMGSPGGLPHYAKKRRRWCHCASGRCLERMVLPGIVSALSFSAYATGSTIQRLMADSRQPQQCSLIRT